MKVIKFLDVVQTEVARLGEEQQVNMDKGRLYAAAANAGAIAALVAMSKAIIEAHKE